MKGLAIIIAALLMSAALAERYTPTVEWDPNPEADVTGYRVHWGLRSGRYPNSTDVGNTTRHTFDLEALTDRTASYFTVVTAYNSAGLESFPSNELAISNLQPARPKNLTIQ